MRRGLMRRKAMLASFGPVVAVFVFVVSENVVAEPSPTPPLLLEWGEGVQ